MPTDSKQGDARLGFRHRVSPAPQPVIMVASPSTLVYLAQVGALWVLHAVGRAVLVTELTVMEAIRAANAPKGPSSSCTRAAACRASLPGRGGGAIASWAWGLGSC